MFILKMIIILLIWLIVLYEANWFTNKIDIPKFLDFKPINCFKCHSTWLGIFVYITLMFQTRWYVPCTIGIILSILTGIALFVDEKNKFIKIEEDNE